jgi:hypothetical protein
MTAGTQALTRRLKKIAGAPQELLVHTRSLSEAPVMSGYVCGFMISYQAFLDHPRTAAMRG